MKKRIMSLVTIILSLVLMGTMALTALAADYEKEFDFLDESTFSSSLIYTLNMKAAGNSKTMGYKGFVGSVGKDSTSVFVFDAAEGKTFDTLTINYRGYSIGESATNYIKFYVSTVGEADYAAGYNEANWTLVGTMINDSTAGTGLNAADVTNRDPEFVRSIDVSAQATGKSRVFLRVDFLRSANIDGVPATFFALKSASGDYAAAPVVTEAPVTEAPVTEAPVTEAPVTEAPVTEAPVTEAPATEAPVTEPANPTTGDKSAVIIAAAIAVAAVATASAVVLRKRENA